MLPTFASLCQHTIGTDLKTARDHPLRQGESFVLKSQADGGRANRIFPRFVVKDAL